MQLRQFIGIAMLSAVSAIYAGAAHAQEPTRAPAGQPSIDARPHAGHDGFAAQTRAAAMPASADHASHDDCVGPASFCNIYFGS